jgi:hypothetical protein
MIYVLAHRPFVLLGTAGWLAAQRREIGRGGFAVVAPAARWMMKLQCIGMIDGGEAEAEAIRRSLAPTPALEGTAGPAPPNLWCFCLPSERPVPWVIIPDLDQWLAANTKPWDGSAAQMLGVKGRSHHIKTSVGLAGRANRARRP